MVVHTCVWQIPKSGTMQVTASVHYNHWATKTTHVEVIPCPQQDSLLNTPDLRKLLKAVWDSSHVDGPVNQRYERYGVLLDSAGARRFVVFPLQGPGERSVCNVSPPANYQPPAGWRVIAGVHDHTIQPNAAIPANLPRCPADGGYYAVGAGPGSGWASPEDWAYSNRTGVPEYIVDSAKVILIRGDAPGLKIDTIVTQTSFGPDTSFQVPNGKELQRLFSRTDACPLLMACAADRGLTIDRQIMWFAQVLTRRGFMTLRRVFA